MKPLHIAATLAAVLATSACAPGMGVALMAPPTAFYGEIDMEDGVPPVIFASPIVVYGEGEGAPIYLHVPPGYERHWGRHCREYNACRRPVYFVREGWYNDVYAPRHGYDGRGDGGYRDRGYGDRGDRGYGDRGDERYRRGEDRGEDRGDRGGYNGGGYGGGPVLGRQPQGGGGGYGGGPVLGRQPQPQQPQGGGGLGRRPMPQGGDNGGGGYERRRGEGDGGGDRGRGRGRDRGDD